MLSVLQSEHSKYFVVRMFQVFYSVDLFNGDVISVSEEETFEVLQWGHSKYFTEWTSLSVL